MCVQLFICHRLQGAICLVSETSYDVLLLIREGLGTTNKSYSSLLAGHQNTFLASILLTQAQI